MFDLIIVCLLFWCFEGVGFVVLLVVFDLLWLCCMVLSVLFWFCAFGCLCLIVLRACYFACFLRLVLICICFGLFVYFGCLCDLYLALVWGFGFLVIVWFVVY